MALSDHFKHIRTTQPYIPSPPIQVPVVEAPAKNKFELRANRASIKIPQHLSTEIVKDKDLLKPYATFFQLKPLYYSGVIKNARSHYSELCKYLHISDNVLRKRINQMLQLDLCCWDGKDLRLTSYAKVCKQNGLHQYYHHINNIANDIIKMDDCLRVVAMKENFDKQEYTANKKLINEEFKNIIAQGEIDRLDSNCREKGIVSTPEMVKTACEIVGNITDPQKYYKPTVYRKVKKLILMRMDVLKLKAQERTENNLKNCEKSKHVANPTITLNCQSVAKLYGCQSPSSGHYWEQIFKNLGLVQVESPQALNINNFQFHKLKNFERYSDENEKTGAFFKESKKPGRSAYEGRKKWYFLRVANSLKISENLEKPLFCC